MKTVTALLLAILAALLLPVTPATAKPVDKPVILAVGDSITYGTGTRDPDRQSWPARMGAERAAVPSGCIVTDPCIGGRRPALNTYNRVVLSQRPDVVIVAYGMNDLVWSTPREIMAGLVEVKRRNDARGIATYVATLTPIGVDVWGLNSHRVALNDRIRAWWPEWRVIDFDAALLSHRGHLPRRFDSGDNLHPNARAYVKMSKVARKALRTAPVSARR